MRVRYLGVAALAAPLLLAAAWGSRPAAATPRLSQPAMETSQPLQVVGSSPDPDARMGSMPGTVSVLFNAAVTNATLRVLGPNGNRVDLDGTTVSGQGGRSVAVTTQDGGTGGYLVAWSAVPAAGGPAVSGALAFAVGRVPGWSTSGVSQYLSAGGAGPALAAAVNVVEGVELAALLALAGLVAALAGRWLPAGRGAYGALTALLATVAVGAIVGLVLHGPFAAGLPVGDALSRSMARATLHSAWGAGGLLAMAGVVLVGAVGAPLALRPAGSDHAAAVVVRRRPASWTDRLALAGAAVMVAAAVAVGHSVGEAAAVAWTALVVVHVASVVALAGLLVIRIAASRQQHLGKGAALDPKLLRATTIAVAVTGLVLAAHDLGAVSAITGTAYGRLLIAKVVATFALLVCVYAVAAPGGTRARRRFQTGRSPVRRSTPRRKAEPALEAAPSEGGAIDALATSVVLFVVLSFVTAMLVLQTPGRLAAPRTVTGTLAASQLYLEYQVLPAHVGANNLHLYVLDGAGSPMSVAGAAASLVWPTESGSPLPIALSNAGPGHYLEYNVEIPLAGTWTLKVDVDTSGSAKPVAFSVLVHVSP